MFLFLSLSNDPAFNLAAEEYFFNRDNEEYCLIYINQNAVVCGKHQIPTKECDFRFVQENNIGIYRRFSGGGTVYHDAGNINFCFISSQKGSMNIHENFQTFSRPINDFLRTMGLASNMNERNNITINGKKVSGNAEHISKNRVLHHGTLLFESDLNFLRNAVKIQHEKYTDSSVPSVPASVCNIRPLLKKDMMISDFVNGLKNHIQNVYETSDLILGEEEINAINKLSIEKYLDVKWIYGYSPSYTFSSALRDKKLQLPFSLQINKGLIQSFEVGLQDGGKAKKIMEMLLDNLHFPEVVAAQINQFKVLHSDIHEHYRLDKYKFF